MHVGQFLAREVFLACKSCGHTERSEQLCDLVPPGANFGYDVMAYAGKAVRRQLFFSLATIKTFVTSPLGGGAAFYVAERQRSGVKSRPPAARLPRPLPNQSSLSRVC